MAQHNPQSRAFLLIVLAAIVVGFIIAIWLYGGGESETASEHTIEHATEDKPDAMESAPAAEVPMEGMSTDDTPPDEEPIDDEGMIDDMSPPDEMIDEPMLDEAPKDAGAEEMPGAADEETPAAPNL